jgi:N-acetylmuramoyl-L-alanine amidase
MRKINKIIIHCSASDEQKDDSVEAIKHLHTSPKTTKIQWGEYTTTGRDFSDIGYHFIIEKSGEIKKGRDIDRVGAHCRGYNGNSIGVCLNGNTDFKGDQFIALTNLLKALVVLFPDVTIHAHKEFESKKPCPNFDVTPYKSI